MTRRLFVGLLSLFGVRAKAAPAPLKPPKPRDRWMTAEVTRYGITSTVCFRADGSDPYMLMLAQRHHIQPGYGCGTLLDQRPALARAAETHWRRVAGYGGRDTAEQQILSDLETAK